MAAARRLLILKPVGFRHVVSDRETLRVGFVSMTALPSIHVGKCEQMGGTHEAILRNLRMGVRLQTYMNAMLCQNA